MYVDGHGSDLGDLLSSHIFRVPEYQRAYAWRVSTEVKDFWTDFVNVLTTHQEKYFMGTMLFAGVDGEAKKRVVIDGQQRMATFLLFLAAIRDVLSTRIDLSEDLRGKQRRYIDGMLNQFDGQREWTRLVMSPHDQPQFEAVLRTLPDPPQIESRNIKAAHAYLKREIKARVDAHGSEHLLEMLERFLTALVVVRIESPSTLDAHVVFEAVNDRGLPLTPAERMKNYVLSRASFAGLFDEVHSMWLAIEGRVGRDNGALDTFLLYYWNSRHNPKVQKDRLYRDFKDEVKQYNVEEKMNEISLESEIYEQLLAPTQAFWRSSRIVGILSEIRALGVKQIYVLLLALGRLFIDGKIAADDLSDALKFILDFSFRYSSVSGLQTNVLEKEYSKLATRLREDSSRLSEIFAALGELMPTDEFMEELLITTPRALAAPINRYILFTIAALELETKEIKLAQEEHHLEHIIPQNPDSIHLQDLQRRGIDHDSVLNRLGNLTVILGPWNQEMSNRVFSEKRPVYERSLLMLNQELAAMGEFGQAELDRRQAEIFDKIKTIWPGAVPARFAVA